MVFFLLILHHFLFPRIQRVLVRFNFRSVRLNDPYWEKMWYLNRGEDLDMNVEEAWEEGVTGKGVAVTILDDGKLNCY